MPLSIPTMLAAACLAAAQKSDVVQAKAVLGLLAAYFLVITILRARRARCLAQLVRDAVSGSDPHHLSARLAFVEFPFMFDVGTSIGFFSTFAVPSISAVLDGSQSFARCSQVRYDDTLILMREIVEHGARSQRGLASLRRLNAVHARYPAIKRDDMAYVLWVFMFEPVRWTGMYEWRPLTCGEVRVLYAFWREVGCGMGIRDLPEDVEEFEAWGTEYERRSFAFKPQNSRLTEHLFDLASTWGPSPPAWLCSQLTTRQCKRWCAVKVTCLLYPSQQVLDCIGLRSQSRCLPRLLKLAIRLLLKLRAYAVIALLPPRLERHMVLFLGPQEGVDAQGQPRYRVGCPRAVLSYAEQRVYTLDQIGVEPDDQPACRLHDLRL